MNSRGKTIENSILPKIKKNAILLTVICVLAVLFLYVVGQFTELHPDAYRDLLRSILFGYGIYLLVNGFYNGIFKKIPAVKMESIKSFKTKNITSAKKYSTKFVKTKKETPLEAICETFMVVTLVNSIMMLTGFDIPKEGTFAYIHMMTRLLIVSGIIGIWMWKDVIEGVKKFTFANVFKNFYLETHKSLLTSISKVFTAITAVYCILMIALHSIINPAGGSFFYQSLLGILGFVTITIFTLRICRKNE